MDDLVQEVEIAAPPVTVWEELTLRGEVQRAMMNTVLRSRLEPGAPIAYQSPDGSRVFVVGRVVECDPPRRLAHSWRQTMRDDPAPTLVAWDLQPTETGTRVRLTHSGWPEDAKQLRRVDAGWRFILRELKNVVERGRPSARARMQLGTMRLFWFALPAATKPGAMAPEREEELARWRS